MKKTILQFFLVLLLLALKMNYSQAQTISIYKELHGHITFDWFGNTNNLADNSESGFNCSDDNVSSSSADILIPSSATIKQAILYWSGSGSGDFQVSLSGPGFTDLDINAEREFNTTFALRNFFGAAYDISSVISDYGSGSYTLSNLNADKSFGHCLFNTIYSGWCILVIYEDSVLPFSTVKIFDGFQTLQEETKNYLIEDILIESTSNTKLGVLAWEGDVFDTQAESIFVNNSKISNALNPVGHIFNGSNSSNNSSDNFNMDLDIFDINAFVNINDTSIPIDIKTGGDVIFLGALVLSYQNKLPDATIIIDTAFQSCNSNLIDITFTVYNENSNDILPQGTTITFYENSASGAVLGNAFTLAEMAIGASETQSIQVTGTATTLFAQIDINESITELEENNNTNETVIQIQSTNPPTSLTDQVCASQLPYTLPDGSLVNSAGDYSSTLSDINGCDSIINLELIISPDAWSIDTEICPGDSIYFDGQFLFNDTTFMTTISSTTGGCDSIITFSLLVKPLQIDSVFATLCPEENYPLPDGTIVHLAGIYETQIGCDTLIINILSEDTTSYFINIQDTFTITIGAEVTLNPQLNFSGTEYLWTPNLFLDCTNCLSTKAQPTQSTWYTFSVLNQYGCLIEKNVFIDISPKNRDEEDEVFIPNVFSPNGDNNNDYFSIQSELIRRIKQVDIYDRWGNLVFAQADPIPLYIWNGKYDDQLVPNGVYIYVIQIEFADGTLKLYSGDLSIWR